MSIYAEYKHGYLSYSEFAQAARNEADPPWCENCKRDADYDVCHRCTMRHLAEENGSEEYEQMQSDVVFDVNEVIAKYCDDCPWFGESECDDCIVREIEKVMGV